MITAQSHSSRSLRIPGIFSSENQIDFAGAEMPISPPMLLDAYSMPEAVATMEVDCRLPGADAGDAPLRVAIRVGRPYIMWDRFGSHALCPISMQGLHAGLPEVAGANTLQAMTLALRCVHGHLLDIIAAGGRVLSPGRDCDYPMEATFGPPSLNGTRTERKIPYPRSAGH